MSKNKSDLLSDLRRGFECVFDQATATLDGLDNLHSLYSSLVDAPSDLATPERLHNILSDEREIASDLEQLHLKREEISDQIIAMEPLDDAIRLQIAAKRKFGLEI